MREKQAKIRKPLIGIAIVLLFVIGIPLFVARTQVGLNLAVAAARVFVPGHVRFTNLRGRLIGPITAKQVDYQRGTMHVTAQDVHFDWGPRRLIHTILHPVQSSGNDIHPILVTGRFTADETKHNITLQFDSLNAEAHTNGWRITAFDVSAHSGHGSMTASGRLNDKRHIEWSANLPKLSDTFKNGSGTLKGHGTIDGPKDSPMIDATVDAANIAIHHFSLAQFQFNIVGSLAPDGQLQTHLSTSDLQLANYRLEKLTIDSNGKASKHIAKIRLLQPDQQILTTLEGGWHRKNQHWAWSGQTRAFVLSTGKLASHGLQRWTQRQPADITFSRNNASLSPLCLQSQEATLCLQGNWEQKKSWSAILNAKQMPLTILHPFLPPTFAPQGNVSASVKLHGKSREPSRLNVQAHLSSPSITLTSLGIKPTHIQLDIANDGQSIVYRGSLQSNGEQLNLHGNTQLNKADYPSQFNIKGTNILVSHTHEFKVYASPDLQIKTQGNDIAITGAIDIPKANLTPRTLQATVSLPNDVVFVDGQDQSKTSHFNVENHIQLTLGNDIYIAMNGLKGKLKGRLLIDDTPKRGTRGTGMLWIYHGQYNAYGQKLMLTRGELHFLDDAINNPVLNIRASKTLKAAVSQGGLARATSIEDLTVGVQIQGKLKHPKTTLYSEPGGYTQAEILSYLILGQPLNNVSSQQNKDLLIRAASALTFGSGSGGGLGGVGNLLSQIKQGLGLSTIGFESEQQIDTRDTSGPPQLIDNTAFVLGKYLSPRLYLSYSYGLITNINRIRLRYSLSRNWSIQTERSTLGTGADVLYSFER